jgi:hypothetical protein
MTIECPYRQPAADAPNGDLAVCGLLQELTGTLGQQLCEVRSDACRACCTWFPPSPRDLNPVVASLLYNLSAQIRDQGGVSGCDLARAAELNELAVQNIPAEDDCVAVWTETNSQANLNCTDLAKLIPRPKRRCGKRVTKWAVGITTAPRNQATLDDCLASLAAAGWKEPRLFVDGEVTLSTAAAMLPITRRSPQIGAWPNYYLSLGELVMRSPHADAYLLVQDDAVFFKHPSLRLYLESVLWPGHRPGLVSLFCSRAYTQPTAGWHELHEPLVWGAQAIIFSHSGAFALLADEKIVQHRLLPAEDGLAKIDVAIGEWALRTGTPVYIPTPSLVQHIGHLSALWPSARADQNRRSNRFLGTP